MVLSIESPPCEQVRMAIRPATTGPARRPKVAKKKLVERCYKIPSLSKCLEFEILPKASIKYKQMLNSNPLSRQQSAQGTITGSVESRSEAGITISKKILPTMLQSKFS
jgi:hypothetical protein